MENSPVHVTSISQLISVLTAEESPTALDIDIRDCGDLQVLECAILLAKSETLTHVVVSYGTGDLAAKAAARALKHSRSIRSFEMGAACGGDEVGLALAEALKQNTSLRSFKIWGGDYSDETGLALAEALKQNTDLRSFTIWDGNYSDETGLAFAEALKQNTDLRSFNILGNYTDETESSLEEALKHNTCLCSFTVNEDDYLDDEYLLRNREAISTWVSLAALARPRCEHGFQGLSDFQFRRALIGNFLPASCKYWPVADRVAGMAPPQAGISPGQPTDEDPGDRPSQVEPRVVDVEEDEEEQDAEQEVKLRLAHQADSALQVEREAADVAQAIQLSKADLLMEEVALLQLTRQACSAAVVQQLQEAPQLAHCRRLVAEAGLELRPEWASGAWLMVPLTAPQLFSMLEPRPELSLRSHHVLVRSRDIGAVKEALAEMAKKRRPQVRLEGTLAELETRADDGGTHGHLSEDLSEEDASPSPATEPPGSASSSKEPAFVTAATSSADPEPLVVVRHTFWHMAEEELASDTASVPNSAPCGVGAAPQPKNPRRRGAL